MQKFILPRTAKAAIRAWLKLPNRYTGEDLNKISVCPFGGDISIYKRQVGRNPCIDICYKIFPKAVITQRCPCHEYTLNYVIRKAKEIIRCKKYS